MDLKTSFFSNENEQGWGCRIDRQNLWGVVKPPTQCPGYDIKQSGGEV